jgi:tetratricopeptide (TPR) repeat protein
MNAITASVPLLALLLAAPTHVPAGLAALLDTYPADSLIAPLRRFERERGRASESAEAAFVLGQLHFARGEYRQACEAFLRAAARLDPPRKPEARYWAGLSWLGLRDAPQARAVLEEVAQTSAALRPAALLGVGQAWELAGRPVQALETFERVLAQGPGEAGPGALERLVALAGGLERPDLARRAGERLRREYPKSVEAARSVLPAASAPIRPAAGVVAAQIGAFVDPARARSLADAARRAGFTSVQVLSQGEGATRLHVVRLGLYASEADARRAGERAAGVLGVRYELVR